LSQLANLYAGAGFTKGLDLHKLWGRNSSFLLLFKTDPDFKHFAFFVNNLVYPEGLEGLYTEVRGYYSLQEILVPVQFKKGNQIIVYVSKDDEEYDNVHSVI
jgi:hypothetical protein